MGAVSWKCPGSLSRRKGARLPEHASFRRRCRSSRIAKEPVAEKSDSRHAAGIKRAARPSLLFPPRSSRSTKPTKLLARAACPSQPLATG